MPSSQSLSQSPSPPPNDHNELIGQLKRRNASLEDDLKSMQDRKKRAATEQETSLARGVRKLVTLHVPLKALVDEKDRQESADSDDEDIGPLSDEEKEIKREQDRNYESFRCLEALFGKKRLTQLLDSEGYLDRLRSWEKHADSARGDDIKHLKSEVANWLNGLDKNNVSQDDQAVFVNPHTREGRGFQNTVTGRLLAPIDYNWDDVQIRQKIRDLDSDFPTHDLYLVRFLYAGYSGDPNNFADGFLKSVLLVRTFKHIYTSSSSALNYNGGSSNSEDGPPRKRQRCNYKGKPPSKKNVAEILGMTTVTPRAIAYAALHFSLTNANTWTWTNDGFDYEIFYHFIIDYFEDRDLSSEQQIKELLRWWNRQVFGNRIATTSPTATIEFKKRLARQRADNAGHT